MDFFAPMEWLILGFFLTGGFALKNQRDPGNGSYCCLKYSWLFTMTFHNPQTVLSQNRATPSTQSYGSPCEPSTGMEQSPCRLFRGWEQRTQLDFHRFRGGGVRRMKYWNSKITQIFLICLLTWKFLVCALHICLDEMSL